MTTPDPRFDRALADLVSTVDRDSVLAVRNAVRFQAERLQAEIRAAADWQTLIPCGRDPISQDFTPDMQLTVDRIVDTHIAHRKELERLVERLDAVARDYGHTDDDIAATFAVDRARLTADLATHEVRANARLPL